jgi:hypothetical protein
VGVCLVQIVSGAILINSVLIIRKFLKSGGNTTVNIKTLIVQSAAFGLFLISISFYAAIYVVYILSEQRPMAETTLLIAACILAVFSFAS